MVDCQEAKATWSWLTTKKLKLGTYRVHTASSSNEQLILCLQHVGGADMSVDKPSSVCIPQMSLPIHLCMSLIKATNSKYKEAERSLD